MKLHHRSDFYTIYHGEAVDWPGAEPIDLVLTNPYGPLPRSLEGKPMLLHQWAHRRSELASWACVPESALQLVGSWNDDRECFWALNMPPLGGKTLGAMRGFRPEPGGWYPLELPVLLLEMFGRAGDVVWDGFMGRGTVGLAAYLRGMRYVGVEQLESHITLARDYLLLDLIDAAA